MYTQNVRSIKISVLIIVIGGIQAILETKMYLNHKFIVDGRLAVPTAVKIVESAIFPDVAKANLNYQGALTKSSNKRTSGSSVALAPKNSNTTLSFMRTRSRTKIAAVVSDTMLDLGAVDIGSANGIAGESNEKPHHEQKEVFTASEHPAKHRININDITLDHSELATLLTQTLQLLFSSEVLVFAEYVEFILPIVYGLYSTVLYNLPYAKYSITFIVFHSEFLSSTLTLCAYSGLECFSDACDYGIYQVAFVLENYWMGVQGRLIGSLVLIFNLNTVHHGVDLSLEFNRAKVLNDTVGQ
uniref:Uncharacterized protein n=1 Tax=Globisporangium ultimum (strain ATCC 200006 / CBS 805.95 / DAOM BR144) TaxID=431595 RepID=K3WCQ9_GLOUD